MKKIYKTILIFNLQFSIFNFQSFSQTAPGIEWQNTIGGSGDDALFSVEQTADGGYILGGGSGSDSSGDKTENGYGLGDYWIVKVDSTGNIQWQNDIGGSDGDGLTSLSKTSDGGYICGGVSWSDSSGVKTENNWDTIYPDYWVVKIDSIGNIQWDNTIGGTGYDWLSSVKQTFDGGYVLGGWSDSHISGDKTENNQFADYWIVKLDSSGNITWQNTITGNGNDFLESLSLTADGGFICYGTSFSDSAADKTEDGQGYYDYWIVKTDSVGNIQWQNTIGGDGYDDVYSISQTMDGGYICGGQSDSDISGDKTEPNWDPSGLNDDYWVIKLDSLGNIQWQNTIGGIENDQLHSVQQADDGNYIIGGFSQSGISGDKTENNVGNSGYYDYWILKLDSSGSIIWQKTIGGSFVDQLYSFFQTADGGYICGGLSNSSISGDKTENSMGGYDYWIIKLAPDAITSISQLPQLPNYPITISPNPLTTQSKLTFKNNNKEKFLFTLYDITGRITESVSTTDNEIFLTKGSKQAGVYLFNLMNEKTGEKMNGKMVISN